ncbi:MAG: hypothetical protein ACKOPT_03885, partial [Cyanobium sp.]
PFQGVRRVISRKAGSAEATVSRKKVLQPTPSATQYALLSGVYALSRSILSGQAGFVAEGVGWSTFFLLTVASALPAFLLMTRLTPWNGEGVRGAYDATRDT